MNTHNYRPWLFASLVCFIVEIDAGSVTDDGVIMAFNTNAEVKLFCLRYFPEIFQLPLKENAFAHSLIDLPSWPSCELSDMFHTLQSRHVGDLQGEVVVVQGRPNCNILEEATMIQNLGGGGVIVVDWKQLSPLYNKSQKVQLNISLAFISNESYQQIKTLGPDVKVIQYATPSKIDLSLAVIWLIAMLCVILGAYWESIARRVTTCLPLTRQDTFPEETGNRLRRNSSEQHKQEIVHLSTPLGVVILVVCMCIMLLLIYFFYRYLVYVLIAMYCLGCASSLYHLSLPFLVLVPVGKLWIRRSLLFLLWASVSVTWLVLRKQSYSWILQDFLSIALMINVLNVLRFPSFKIITILLALLFLYDIFFVFITPLFTKNGESVMVEAASGGNGGGNGGLGGGTEGEQMPMVFKVPHFNWYSICEHNYLMLGLGDILFPGLLVGYCFRFQAESRLKLYFIASVVSYGVGMIITFLALILMASAQPALLYLVPTMLLTCAGVALVRKEFYSFWTGTSIDTLRELKEDDDSGTVTTEVDVANGTVIANESLCEGVLSENGNTSPSRLSR
ncbi:Signal peptide peptidase-like 2A [Chamberlinius hualienensis]